MDQARSLNFPTLVGRRPVARLVVAGLIALLGLGFLVPLSAPASAQTTAAEIPVASNGMPRKAYFQETGHHLAGEFLQTWMAKGDFTIYGFPLTDPLVEDGRVIQYFERARLELWPENAGSEWVIQGTQLGVWKAEQVDDDAPFEPVAEPAETNPDVYYFPETQHTLANAFKRYWDEYGGVHVFGFPISEEFREGEFIVQYFERARFEYHPENAGTDYEVLLGHLGREYAEAHDVEFDPEGRAGDAVNYDPGIFTTSWQSALSTWNGRWAFVETGALNVRSEPNLDATVLDVVYHRRPLTLKRMVRGVEEKGNDAWFELASGGYVPAVYVDPLIVPAPPQTFGGTWVDVNLSEFYAIAYEGSTPVHVAIITAGRGDRTPTGTFSVQRRVENETMDSATVGFPPGHPEHYYLENVLYTQYFLTGGFALHGNYWTAEASFGAFSSNGCVGLLENDAYFFWTWLGLGSVVNVHY